MSLAPTPKRAAIHSLTSLRFIAAALIVLHHSEMKEVLLQLPVLKHLQLDHGVSFFFVLSGFILSYNYQHLPDAAARYNFMLSRVARIFPAHLFFLALFLGMTGYWRAWLVSPWLERLLLNALLLQSWIPVKETYFAFNSLAWSVSTELFFYFVFAALVNRLDKLWPLLLLAASVVIPALAYACVRLRFPDYASAPPNAVNTQGLLYIFPPARILEFFFGVAIYQLRQRIQATVLRIEPHWATLCELTVWGLLLISMAYSEVVSWQIASHSSHVLLEYLGHASSFPCFGLIVLCFSFERGLCSQFLRRRLFVFLGEVSYSLYLCHAMIYTHLGRLNGTFWLKQVVFWICILSVSSLAYLFVEKPLRKLLVSGLSIRPPQPQHIVETTDIAILPPSKG